MPNFRPAPAVKVIAERLIADHHKDLAEAEPRIEYVFRDKAAKSAGKSVWGRARKVSGLNAYLAGDMDEVPADDDEDLTLFAIEIAEDIWAQLDEQQRIALVDHELCHLQITEKDGRLVLGLKHHDLEEFRAVIERHGLWRDDVEEFTQTIRQLSFDS